MRVDIGREGKRMGLLPRPLSSSLPLLSPLLILCLSPLQCNLDMMKGQGTGKICLAITRFHNYWGSFSYSLLLLGKETYTEDFVFMAGLSLRFQVAELTQQVGGESNSEEFLSVLFFFHFPLKVAGEDVHSRLGKIPDPCLSMTALIKGLVILRFHCTCIWMPETCQFSSSCIKRTWL